MKGKLFGFALFAALFAYMPVAQADISVENLWLRESIPGQPNGAGFGVLRNNSDVDIILVAASVDIANDVELHQHVRDGEQMRMEQMDALVIPAGAAVTLQPGGYHLMLMQLQTPLRVGESHDVVLIFADGSELTVNAEVRALVRNQHRH